MFQIPLQNNLSVHSQQFYFQINILKMNSFAKLLLKNVSEIGKKINETNPLHPKLWTIFTKQK